MKRRSLLALLLLTGCLIPGRRSEPVVFHAFSAPSSVADRVSPHVCIPRASVPAGLRRPTLAIESPEGVTVHDSHRWLGPLETAVSEAVGRRITALTGLPCSLQPPSEGHLMLLIEVLRMDVHDGQARLRVRFRLQDSEGELRNQTESEWSSPLKSTRPGDFVAAQSSNLDKAAASVVSLLPGR